MGPQPNLQRGDCGVPHGKRGVCGDQRYEQSAHGGNGAHEDVIGSRH
jgi:hypothetical protein